MRYSLGQAGVAAAGGCICVVWLFTALLLGRKHVALAKAGASSARAGAGEADAAEKQLL